MSNQSYVPLCTPMESPFWVRHASGAATECCYFAPGTICPVTLSLPTRVIYMTASPLSMPRPIAFSSFVPPPLFPRRDTATIADIPEGAPFGSIVDFRKAMGIPRLLTQL